MLPPWHPEYESANLPSEIQKSKQVQSSRIIKVNMANALVLSSLTPHTGNRVTTDRISAALRAATGVTHGRRNRKLLRSVTAADVHEIGSPESLAELLVMKKTSVIFGVHAYRSGRLLLDCGVPFVVILGGTDVNVDMHSSPAKRAVIMRALRQVRHLAS